VEVLIPSIEEEFGVEFMLSSLDEELETAQGKMNMMNIPVRRLAVPECSR